jgi:DNA (cytosine-5)-methyltransferase 1
MRIPEYELIVDLFAGGGGASEGIRVALGRSPDIAINHDDDALSMHRVNHPYTRHLQRNLRRVNPMTAIGDAPIGLLWASPDCTHHSKAKGGKPVKKHRRDLAWIVTRWARAKRPRVIMLENVEEFQKWGPLVRKLGPDGNPILDVHGSPLLVPCKRREGQEFGRWIESFRRLGYRVEWRERRAYHDGVPTTRKRLFVIMRRDGRPIVWPAPTHDRPKSPAVLRQGLAPWRTAAECIDWSLPCPSIFLTREEGRAIGVKRPLADATMARIAKGVFRYVINAAEPFIVPITHGRDASRGQPVSDPLCTITTAHRGEQALITPFVSKFNHGDKPDYCVTEPARTIVATGAHHALIAPYLVPRYGERPGQEPRSLPADAPMPTIVGTANGGSLVAAFLAQHNTEKIGVKAGRDARDPLSTVTGRGTQQQVVTAFLAQNNYEEPGHDARSPLSTIVAKGCTQSIVAAHLMTMKGSDRASHGADEPLSTVCASTTHAAEVRAFLIKYYGAGVAADVGEPLDAVTSKPRFGLVLVHGAVYQIVDIGMRMLTPRELYRAHAFRDDYIIDRGHDGRRFTKTTQVRMVGNSVPPPFATALVRANLPELAVPAPELLDAAAGLAWADEGVTA